MAESIFNIGGVEGQLKELSDHIGSLITKKIYDVTVSANQYVPPFSYSGQLDVTADRALYGNVISVMVYASGAIYVGSVRPDDLNKVYIVSGVGGTMKVTVIFSKQMNVIS